MNSVTAKALYTPVGLVLSIAAGALASRVTRRVWLLLADEEKVPDADDADSRWAELLIGVGLQAAVLAVAKASAKRLKAAGIRHAVEHEA